MPYSDVNVRREQQRISYHRQEAERRAREQTSLFGNADISPIAEPPPPPDDPIQAFVEWSHETLRVPTGPLTDRPFVIPDWQRKFLEGAFAPGVIESGLSVARKNGKSGIIAAYLLAHLAGPLCRRNWRGVVVSLTGNLAKELRDAMSATCRASGLHGISFFSTPIPGRATGYFDTRVDFLAADKATGHAIGSDLVIIDEAGLIDETGRALWNAVLSSTSGRNGRLCAISIRGDGPMFGEIADRANDPSVYWQEYVAKEDAAYDDEQAWHDANPGLVDGIKSTDYMRRMARRAMDNPANGPHFAAYDLNLPQEPSRELIVTLHQFMEAVVLESPSRRGPCTVGLDLGGSSSMTAAVAYWPECGRIEVMGAFPAIPDLRRRGEADGVGGLYVRMAQDGELEVYEGRVTPVKPFIDKLMERLAGERVLGIGFDRYRREEALQALGEAGCTWAIVPRGQGASATADGSADVRAFQEEVLGKRMKPVRSRMLEAAIANSSVTRDSGGNPRLDKGKSKGRIDALQAAVIACGLGRRWRSTRGARRGGRYIGTVG